MVVVADRAEKIDRISGMECLVSWEVPSMRTTN